MIKSKLSEAEDSVRAALVYALENKKDKHVSKLFDLYNSVRTVKNSVGESDFVFTINTAGNPYMETTPETIDWLNNYSSAKSDLTFNNNPDIITFS
jgi:hypothetical protein